MIRGHRSLRSYAPDAVPADIVEKLLEAAHWAPSAHNRQPWRFVLLNEATTRRQLAESMARQWQAELLADGEDPAASRQRAARSVRRITDAPLAILPCLDLDSLDTYPDSQRRKREWQMGVQSVASPARTCCWPHGTMAWRPAGCAHRSSVPSWYGQASSSRPRWNPNHC